MTSFCLPYPPDSLGHVPAIEIPYVAKYPFDTSLPNLFDNFAHECGFEDYDRPPEQLAELMQSWLFFGLISSICNQDIDHAIFVRDRNQHRYIDVRLDVALDTLVTERLEVVRNLTGHRARKTWAAIARAIQSAEQRAFVFEKTPGAEHSSLPLVALSVQVLLQWLVLKINRYPRLRPKSEPTNVKDPSFVSVITKWLSNDYEGDISLPNSHSNPTSGLFPIHLKPHGFDGRPLSTGVLLKRFSDQGWCPHRVHNTCSSLSCVSLYYVSSLAVQFQNSGSHDHCSSSSCVVKHESQPARHKDEVCTCSGAALLKPDMDRIREIIRMGEIPLIDIRFDDKSGEINVSIIKAAGHTRYTAISHVWSDNQFGSDKNSLPQCQVKHLLSLIECNNKTFGFGFRLFDKFCSIVSVFFYYCGLTRNKTSGRNLFWLDTFCVPCGDVPEDSDLRLRAISMMDLIYSNANEVLAIDYGLQKIHCEGTTLPAVGEGLLQQCYQAYVGPSQRRFLQTMAFAFSSNWMGRAWTLQEAVLARCCLIQFHDCILNTKILQPYIETNVEFGEMMPSTAGSRYKAIWKQEWATFATKWDRSRQSDEGRLSSHYKLFFSFFRAILMTIGIYVCWPLAFSISYPDIDRVHEAMMRPLRKGRIVSLEDQIVHELGDYIYSSLKPPVAINHRSWTVPNSAERFKNVWNAMAGRTTTKSEDLHIILANLLGFNAGAMMRSCITSRSRMRAIIDGLDELPLDILFLDVSDELETSPENAGASSHSNWIPLHPGVGRLEANSRLLRRDSGYIMDLRDETAGSIVTFSAGKVPRTTRIFELTSYLAALDAEDANGRKIYYMIECLTSQNEDPRTTETQNLETYIVFYDSANSACKGARFSVIHKEGRDIHLRHECAVRVFKMQDTPSQPSILQFRARERPIESDIWLEYEPKAGFEGASSTTADEPARLQYRPMNPRHPINLGHSKSAYWFIQMVTLTAFILILVAAIKFGQNMIAPIPSTDVRVSMTVFYVLFCHATCYFWAAIPYYLMSYSIQMAAQKSWTSTFRDDWTPSEGTGYQSMEQALFVLYHATSGAMWGLFVVCIILPIYVMTVPLYGIYKIVQLKRPNFVSYLEDVLEFLE